MRKESRPAEEIKPKTKAQVRFYVFTISGNWQNPEAQFSQKRERDRESQRKKERVKRKIESLSRPAPGEEDGGDGEHRR